MKIILAQGNPGIRYATTRHNIGWLLLDAFASSHGATFVHEKKFFADIASTSLHGEKVLLVKPTTFYNETGRTARAISDYYKLSAADDILVIHDDLALPFGAIRIRDKGSDGGNNGIKSLSSHLGPSYWRIRVGIWNELRDRQPDVDFVLGSLNSSEAAHIRTHLTQTVSRLIEDFVAGTLSVTSHSSQYDS